MFRFANPQYLWLLLAVPALVALYALAARSRRKRLARFGNPAILEELMPEVSTGRTAFKFILFCTAVALLVLAAARPQFGSKLREEKAQGIEMMLTIDVSNSMLAEDFQPNRLERTKYAIGKLFEGLQQDRVGLVVFAGEPKVQLPITSDYRMARAFARRIDPSLVSVQGTAIGKALEQALLSFSGDTEESHGRVIILITDGENHDDDAVAVAERAAQMGVKIFTIGIGTPEGAPIQIGGEFIKDETGEMVVSKLNEEMLARIADITGGAYVRSSKQSIGLDEIVTVGGGVDPTVQHPVGDPVGQRFRRLRRRQRFNDLQFDFHPLRADGANGDGDGIPFLKILPPVGKAGEIGRQLHKAAIIHHTSDDARHRFSRRELTGVFQPCSQQLLVAEQDAEVFLDSGHDGADVLTGSEAVAGVRDAGDRNAVDGNEGWDAATDIHKAPERLQMGDPCGDDVAGSQGGQQLLPTEQLSLTAGEDGGNAAVGVLLEMLHQKADRLVDPRKQRNVPGAAVADADGSFTARDASLTEAEVHNQVMLLGADNGARL